jgi:hypothetical protein
VTALTSPESNKYDIIGFKHAEKSSPLGEVDDDKLDEAVELIPDRIVISPPQWTNKGQYLHERSAWVIMSTIAHAQLALKLLKNLVVSIRDHEKITVEVTDVIYEFTLNAKLHTPKMPPALPEALSHSNRIIADTKIALELASLLDDERNVSADNRLSAILDEILNRDVAMALSQNPTGTLDLAIAYLRRVHFVDFYRGRKFRDEAHLLSVASGISCRSVPFILDNIDASPIDSSLVTSADNLIESKENVDDELNIAKDVITDDMKTSEILPGTEVVDVTKESAENILKTGTVDTLPVDSAINVKTIDVPRTIPTPMSDK